MLFKRKIKYQSYCDASVEAALQNTDEATLKEFRQACGDIALDSADQHIYQNHLRALFIEMLLIAISKRYSFKVALPTEIFVHQKLKELNLQEVSEICTGYSQAFASPSLEEIAMGTDGIRNMAQYFDKAVCEGQLKQETVGRLDAELRAVLKSHFKDFKSIKLID